MEWQGKPASLCTSLWHLQLKTQLGIPTWTAGKIPPGLQSSTLVNWTHQVLPPQPFMPSQSSTHLEMCLAACSSCPQTTFRGCLPVQTPLPGHSHSECAGGTKTAEFTGHGPRGTRSNPALFAYKDTSLNQDLDSFSEITDKSSLFTVYQLCNILLNPHSSQAVLISPTYRWGNKSIKESHRASDRTELSDHGTLIGTSGRNCTLKMPDKSR